MTQTAIVTVAIGDVPYFKYAEPLMRHYAKKIGADFIVIDNRSMPDRKPNIEKWRTYHLLDKYVKVLYLDADILINPNSPNIFELVGMGVIGVVDNELAYDRVLDLERNVMQLENGYINWHRKFPNSGVILADFTHKQIFHDLGNRKIKNVGRWVDNTIFNYLLYESKLPIKYLDMRWNFLETFKHFNIPPEEVHFMHFAGGGLDNRIGDRTKQMEHFSKIYMDMIKK